MVKALEGIRILDLGRFIAVPFATGLMVAMGAEVVKVEPPGGTEEREVGEFFGSVNFTLPLCLCSNVKGITLNLNSARGQELLDRLVPHFDVIADNFPAAMKKQMGLSYERFSSVNPRIVALSVTAFPEGNAYADWSGMDASFQALCGFMSLSGFEGNPPAKCQTPFIDYCTGYAGAVGVLAALYERSRSGKGQRVEVNLLETALSLLRREIAENKLGFVRKRIGNENYWVFSDTFEASDGWVVVFAGPGAIWRRFTKAIGSSELLNDPAFATDLSRFHNRQRIRPIVVRWMASRTTAEITDIMAKSGVPAGRVNTLSEFLDSPYVTEDLFANVEYPGLGTYHIPRPNIKFSRTESRIDRATPAPGEHNREVYCGMLGLATPLLESLRKEGTI